ncbi:SLAP domain-containing protein [Alkalihalobacillus sp. CinArs1]|uniref:SLAP domain-containing protein n=1 Tax=Alkalihalobacillus sp. CinArs1 TaxID=2995314 RepID=UPI0022DE5FCA|nr:SLAP domain-containing protein [Alkalihalobacillus sp. CinArs1]
MTLKFEEKWERTISEKDRMLFYEIYKQYPIKLHTVAFAPVRVAINHRGSLLATVLVLNGHDCEWKLNDTILHYCERGELVAVHSFSHSSLVVPPRCAMPWTFIYNSNTFQKEPELKHWEIKFL